MLSGYYKKCENSHLFRNCREHSQKTAFSDPIQGTKDALKKF